MEKCRAKAEHLATGRMGLRARLTLRKALFTSASDNYCQSPMIEQQYLLITGPIAITIELLKYS